MTIYCFNVIFILCQLIIFGKSAKKDKTRNKASMVLFFSLLFVEMAFMGDGTGDIRVYYQNFCENYGELRDINLSYVLNNILKDGYIGYILINLVIKEITGNFIYVLIFCGFVTAFGYTKFIYKYSEITWLSMLILLCSGSYYAGFNILRQIMAASLFCLCVIFLINGNFVKYTLSVIAVATIHYSAFILIPLYFVLRYDWSKIRRKYKYIILLALITVFFITPYLIAIITRFAYQEYSLANAFGMNQGTTIHGTLKAFTMGGIVLASTRKFQAKDMKERIILNGSILYLVFSVMGARILMVQRLANFFVPFLLLAYPLLINRSRNRNRNLILITCLFIGLNINPILRGEYHFFWDNQILTWGF